MISLLTSITNSLTSISLMVNLVRTNKLEIYSLHLLSMKLEKLKSFGFLKSTYYEPWIVAYGWCPSAVHLQ